MPKKIGLTGGIGSGKSTAAKIFEVLGVPVYYADAAAKRLYQTNAELQQKLKAKFGDAIYNEGSLDRIKLSTLVFGHPKNMQWLNAVVHPLTIADAMEWMEQQTTPYVVKEAALLFEAGATQGLDFVIGVQAQQHLRIHRVMARDGLTRAQVLERIDRQLDEDIKMKLCDFVLINDEQQLLVPQVVKLHKQLLSLCANES